MNKTGLSTNDSYLIQKVCMNTTLSGSAGSLTVYFLVNYLDKVESVSSLSNGLLSGLVGITGSCDAANE